MELDWSAVKAALREVLEEEAGYGRYPLARKWEGGTVELKPADDSLKGKEIPLEIFFKKLVAVREKLRVLEQKINNHPKLDYEDKFELQQQITRAYGSLTTFNILFKEEEDKFSSSGER